MESKPLYEVEENDENGLIMAGLKPVIQFEKPSEQIVENEGGEYEIVKSLGWVKFSADFRNNMLKKLKGAKLSVFMCICLHLNENGESFPSIDKIAEETDYDRDTVMSVISELETIPNLLGVLRERGKVNHYYPAFVARGKRNEPVQKIRPVGQPVQKSWTSFDETSPEKLDSKERGDSKKNPLSEMKKRNPPKTVEGMIWAGVEVTETETELLREREKRAIDAFESAFGLERPWNWYPDKPGEEKVWADLRAFVVEKYEADHSCFTKYFTWSKTDYVKGAMSPLKIKQNPQDFPTSWTSFKSSENVPHPVYNPLPKDERKYVPPPENLRPKITHQ